VAPPQDVAQGQDMRVLLIEDDDEAARHIVRGLVSAGHDVEAAGDGNAGLRLGALQSFDVMVIDRMLPGLDGLSIVEALRTSGVRTPVLLLTALGGVEDRVDGLDAGADDYLVKPFALAELRARVNALGRRVGNDNENAVLRIADLELNMLSRTVVRAGRRIDLAPREFRLLETLMRNSGRLMTRKMLLEQVWGFHFDPKTSIVQTFVSRLRSKIDRDFEVPLVHTVRGRGYSIDAPAK
jgi:two-component system OmpR family response regulator